MSGALVLGSCLLISFFFIVAVSALPGLQALLLLILWIALPLLWLIAAYVSWQRFQRTQYVFGENYLIVKRGSIFGDSSEKYVRYDTIVSVKSVHKRGRNFGSIELTLKEQDSLKLIGVERPNEQLVQVEKILASTTQTVNMLPVDPGK